jgi:hypothetical protein
LYRNKPGSKTLLTCVLYSQVVTTLRHSSSTCTVSACFGRGCFTQHHTISLPTVYHPASPKVCPKVCPGCPSLYRTTSVKVEIVARLRRAAKVIVVVAIKAKPRHRMALLPAHPRGTARCIGPQGHSTVKPPYPVPSRIAGIFRSIVRRHPRAALETPPVQAPRRVAGRPPGGGATRVGGVPCSDCRPM